MWIEIFQTGKHTDSSGNERDWSMADLAKIKESYDPAQHEAPVVIGHPLDNAPAYGWVKGLKLQGGKLLAQLGELAPEFVRMVQAGRFKKRSISLFADFSLRHLGFLGAVPPAVKGLVDVSFQGDQAALEIEFNEPDQPDEGVQPMKDYLMLADGRIFKVKAQRMIAMDDAEYQAWLSQGNQPEGVKSESIPSEKELQLQTQLVKLQKETRFTQARDFSQGLVAQGRLTPAQAQVIPALLVELEEEADQNFAEGGSPSLASRLKGLLAGLPLQGHFRVLGVGQGSASFQEDQLGQEIAQAAGCPTTVREERIFSK